MFDSHYKLSPYRSKPLPEPLLLYCCHIILFHPRVQVGACSVEWHVGPGRMFWHLTRLRSPCDFSGLTADTNLSNLGLKVSSGQLSMEMVKYWNGMINLCRCKWSGCSNKLIGSWKISVQFHLNDFQINFVIDGWSVSFPLGECQWTSSMVSQHWFRQWLGQAASHSLGQCWSSSLWPYEVTRPQGVKCSQLRTHPCTGLNTNSSGRYRADDIIFMYENTFTLIDTPLKFVPEGSFNAKLTLV